MSSANGNNITESFNSIRDDDDLCVSCGKHGCASKSNLCKVCQKGMGIKKISARRLAQLGWTAEESFGAEKNPHHYVKGTGGTPYVGDCDACGSKGSLLEDTRTLHIITCDKCGAFEEELFDAESFGAEEFGDCNCPKCDGLHIGWEMCVTCDNYTNPEVRSSGSAWAPVYYICNTCNKPICEDCDNTDINEKTFCDNCVTGEMDAESFGAEYVGSESDCECGACDECQVWNYSKIMGGHDSGCEYRCGYCEDLGNKEDMVAIFTNYYNDDDGLYCITCHDKLKRGTLEAESFESESSSKEMTLAYNTYKKNLNKYVGFGDTWDKIHDESLKLQKKGLIAFDAWQEACKKLNFYDDLTRNINMKHLRDYEKKYEPNSYYGPNHYDAESFDAEESSKGLPWMTFALIGLGAFVASRVKTVNFKAHDDCGCGCSGAGGCGDEKKADEGHYPNTYDPVQDFLPRYRYPEDSDWSNSYNPTDPYRPLDYQTVQTDTSVTADRM